MPQISFSIGGPTTDITGKTSEEIMNIVKDNYATEKTTIKPKKLVLKKKLKKKLDTMNEKRKNEETKCEDCDIINAEDFSYNENRCFDCCYINEMRSVMGGDTKCEDCDIINAKDFSYYENRCGDCCYKKDMRNREYEREQENMRRRLIDKLDYTIDERGVELLELIQGLGTELKKKCDTYEEGKLLLKQALAIGEILDRIAFREDGRL
tara:strand:+ start:772 stop:1398 length:627 start_codon:yes stop_codon:yes gene_type:complete